MTVKSKRYTKGVITKPTTSPATEEGETRNDSADNKQKIFTEGAEREVVTNNQTQTLENKTIDSVSNTVSVDADNATISNLEVDNLKAGVLSTDISVAGTDTEIPSAAAVRSHVADQIAGKDEASEITFDDTNPNVAGTNVQTALDNVADSAAAAQGSGDSAQADIDAHIADTVDAHDASAVSVVPSGNLAATDTQSALEELQTDIDTRATSGELNAHITDTTAAHAASAVEYVNTTSGLIADNAQAAIDEVEGRLDTTESVATGAQSSIDNHIADAADAHTASAITNVPSGNLVATDMQAAVDELQTDIDTRALDADLTSHTGATSGVHGVVGDVVGTSDTQTLENKTLDGASIENPVRSDVKKDTKANLEVYAITADNGQTVFATDEKQMYQIVDAELVSIGGSGVGGVDIFHVERFEQTEVADATSGNNATFLGGGSLAGSLVDEEASPLKGDRSFKYTQASGSLNDYVALPEVVLDTKEQDNTAGVVVYTTYAGNDNEIDFVVYDNTGTEVIARLPLKSSSKTLKQELIFNIPSSSTGLRYGVQTVVENDGAILVFDEIEFKLNPLTPTNITGEHIVYHSGYTSRDGNNFYLLPNEDINEADNDIIEVTSSGYTGYLFKKTANFTAVANYIGSSGAEMLIRLYDSSALGTQILEGRDAEGSNGVISVTLNGRAQAGNILIVAGSVPNNQQETNFSVRASATSQGVIVKNVESTDISSTNTFTAKIQNNGTATLISQSLDFIDSVSRTATGNVTVVYKSGVFNTSPVVTVTSDEGSAEVNSSIASQCQIGSRGPGSSSETDQDLYLTVTKQDSDYVKESERVYTVPVDSLTSNSISLEGNDGRSITAVSESVPFNGSGLGWTSGADGSTTTNGNYYEVQKDNSKVQITVATQYAADATNRLRLNLNGSFYKYIGNQSDSTVSYTIGTYVSTRGEFSKGDKLSISLNDGATLLTSTNSHYLNINEEYGDRGVFVGNIPTNKFQTKILSSDVTSSGDVAELQFNNLTIGKTYRINGQVGHSVVSGGSGLAIFSGAAGTGENYANSFVYEDGGGQQINTNGLSGVFRASSTTMYVNAGASPTTRIRGDGTRSQTYITLEEANDLRETTDFS